MLHSLAIAMAVSLISPVTILTLTKASSHYFTASLTSGLNGSLIPTKPIIVKDPTISSSKISSTFYFGISL